MLSYDVAAVHLEPWGGGSIPTPLDIVFLLFFPNPLKFCIGLMQTLTLAFLLKNIF